MSLDNLACAFIETSINKLHQLDSNTATKRNKLDNQIIGVELKELNKPLYFVISSQQIDVLNHFEGEPDCFIRFSLTALGDLKKNNQLTTLIKTGQLEVDGDIQIAQQFAQLMTEMDIDWEEHLSKKVGDVLAHKFCYFASGLYQQHKKQFTRLEKHTANLITHELKIAPGPLEVAHFCDQIEDLEKAVNQTNKHIQSIANKLHNMIKEPQHD